MKKVSGKEYPVYVKSACPEKYDLFSRYRPLTSRPFLADSAYREYSPCPSLRPFIACFWTSDESQVAETGRKQEFMVIPDTCMDIIIRINRTRQEISGYLSGLQDGPFRPKGGQDTDDVTVFAVRFHFWAAHLFLNINFKEAANRLIYLQELDREWRELFLTFITVTSMTDRIALTEEFLMKRLAPTLPEPRLFNAVSHMLASNGNVSVKGICEAACISQRQMERLFSVTVGLPPKRISRLVRYQNVWKDVALARSFHIQDAVFRYGYTDQAHLLKEFRRFHGVLPMEAKRIAVLNQ